MTTIELYEKQVLRYELVLKESMKALPELLVDQAGRNWLRVGFSRKYVRVYPSLVNID